MCTKSASSTVHRRKIRHTQTHTHIRMYAYTNTHTYTDTQIQAHVHAYSTRAYAHVTWIVDIPVIDSILDVQTHRRCIIYGTVYKDMKLKPNILDEYHAREHYEAPPPARAKYVDPETDCLILEDQTGRIELGGAVPTGRLVTGVVVALLGHEADSGEFIVQDTCYADLPVPKPLPKAGKPQGYVCLLSGLNIDARNQARFSLNLLIDYLNGFLGLEADASASASITRVIIAGNLIGETDHIMEDLPEYQKRNMQPETVVHMKEVDIVLSQLGAAVDVDFFPGPRDPSNNILPQQPLNSCMFPKARKLSSIHGKTNPYQTIINGRRFLGTAGQGVDDVFRFSEMDDRLEILESTLRWGHLFPTAPDSLGCFPYASDKHTDPFVISDFPNVYFAGNQPKFASKLLEGADGQACRLVCIPEFSTTHTAVLLNLETLDCQTVTISVPDDTLMDGQAL
eukprot:m.105579 g.105579  ORF g.105579 m.105579 type:complete len:454 (+) comp13281_c0_seq3:73-1434(+)